MKKIGPSKKAATNFLNKVEAEVAEDRYIDRRERPSMTIRHFIENEYQPWCETYNRGMRTKQSHLNQIKDLWGDKLLGELTDKDLDKFRWRMRNDKKPVMYNRTLTVLSHMYTIAIQYKRIDHCPVTFKGKKIKEQPRLRYLMPDEVEKLLEKCSEHLRPIVLTALHTGMRKTEILSMRLGIELDLKGGLISLAKTKNDEPRHIPINETLKKALTQVAKGKSRGDYIFTYNKNKKAKAEEEEPENKPMLDVKRSWAKALKDSGIEDFHFHDLRHTFASNLVMNGVDLYTVRDLLGQKDIKMTQRYAHLSPDHRARAVTTLDHVYGTGKAEKVVKF